MKDLNQLILILKKGIDKNSNYIKTIRDPHLLIKSLKELNNSIGNRKIKTSISMQVSHLIMNKLRSQRHHDEEHVMLNVLLCGDPGVGKTMIGTIVAKIWYSLGYLKGAAIKPKSTFVELTEDNSQWQFFLFIILIWVIALTWQFYNSYGGLFTFLLIITIIAIAAALWYKMPQTVPHVEYEMKEEEIIRIVSRSNLVAGYVGQTAPKTRKVLEECLGKVLFVDESYSLCQSPEDSFGAECVNEINLFLSQHPDEIIVIFAGYKDLIEASIFATQPGLKRRFMWQFDCEGYDSKELFDIFQLKVDKQHLKLKEKEEIKSLFNQHHHLMKNYGGDCEKILFYSKLEHSNDYMESPEIYDIDTLETEHVNRGFDTFMENTLFKDEKTGNPMVNFMNMFREKSLQRN